jgi:hypothetical protein
VSQGPATPHLYQRDLLDNQTIQIEAEARGKQSGGQRTREGLLYNQNMTKTALSENVSIAVSL